MHPCQSHGRVLRPAGSWSKFRKNLTHASTQGRDTPPRTALIYILQAIHEATDGGNCGARMFFADYSKGFDLIDHSILLRELAFFDKDSVLINWIRAFMTGRSQAVRIGNFLSDWKSPSGGIPQGTKLGEILFAVMTNNLLRDWHLRIKFVDDTTAEKKPRH